MRLRRRQAERCTHRNHWAAATKDRVTNNRVDLHSVDVYSNEGATFAVDAPPDSKRTRAGDARWSTPQKRVFFRNTQDFLRHPTPHPEKKNGRDPRPKKKKRVPPSNLEEECYQNCRHRRHPSNLKNAAQLTDNSTEMYVWCSASPKREP